MNPRAGFPPGSTAWVLSCPGRYLRWVRDGTSEAALKVFGGLNGSEPFGEINGTVGGTVYPVLYVTIGAGERCTTGSVTLRIADEYPGYWDGTEAYTDTSISLSSASGWEVYNGSSWVGAQDGPSSTDNKEGATPLRYRYVVTGGWLTHKTPFGNNGPHSLSTTSQIEFEEWVVGQGWTNEYPCGPAATSVTTENLWISSCTASNGTIDYFKYDPDGDTALAHPHLQFTISDADPHKYCCIIRFRQTIGEGTWNWDSGWSSMRKNLGINRTVDIDLTVPDDEGHCLNEDDHEWGTYTYDFLVLEYEGDEPKWIQNDAHDWNFLKRYREGYYLWVPKDLPSPYGDKPGHDVWTETPESADTQLRGYYCLESEWASAEEAQVPRLDDDVCIVVVDSELNERATRTGPSVPETLGENYGTVDSDQNQKLDGLLLYTFQDSDPAGTWRGIFTAADNGGLRSPEWRSHTPLRMITANQEKERVFGVVCLGNMAGLTTPDGFPRLNGDYLRKAGYAVPRWFAQSREIDQAADAWPLLIKWLGYKEVSPGAILPDPQQMAYAMDFFGHGWGNRIAPGKNDPARIGCGSISPPFGLNVDAYRRMDGSLFAHLHACYPGQSFAPHLVSRGITAVLASPNALSSGWVARRWNERFYGYATGEIDGACHNLNGSLDLAKDYFRNNMHSPPGDPNWPDGHYNYTTMYISGNAYVYLSAP